MPSTGTAAVSACWLVGLPPLHTTRQARRAASSPGRYDATRALAGTEAGMALPAVAAITVTGKPANPSSTLDSRPPWPELPSVTYTTGNSGGSMPHHGGNATGGDQVTGPR